MHADPELLESVGDTLDRLEEIPDGTDPDLIGIIVDKAEAHLIWRLLQRTEHASLKGS